MKLQIDKIVEAQTITIEEEIDFSERDLPFTLIEKARARLTFEDLGNREILVKGVIFAKLKLTCVICLDEFVEEIKIDVSETYVPARFISKGQSEERPIEELSEFTYNANYLDTYEIVKDNILEFLPPYPKCPKCASQSEKS